MTCADSNNWLEGLHGVKTFKLATLLSPYQLLFNDMEQCHGIFETALITLVSEKHVNKTNELPVNLNIAIGD